MGWRDIDDVRLSRLLPPESLARNAPDTDIERALDFARAMLKTYLQEFAATPEEFRGGVSLQLVDAPRDMHSALHWRLATAYWLLDSRGEAMEAGRKYLATRTPPTIDRIGDSAVQRMKNAFRK